MKERRIEKKFGHLREQSPFIYDEIFKFNIYNLQESDVRGKVVIDVGANLGFFSILCSYYGAKLVIAVEPQPEMYASLLENTRGMDRIKTFRAAVLDEAGKTVKISSRGGESSIYHEGEVSTSEIGTLTVDSLLCDPLEAMGIKDEDMVLKIDAEGVEYDILLNMSDKTFSRFNTILLEIHSELHPVHKGFDLIINKLEERGFKYSSKVPLLLFNESGNPYAHGPQANYRFDWSRRFSLVNEKPSVLCCISTKDRYFTTLPLAISSIISQTVVPDELVIFDDGEHKDLRNEELYVHLFRTLDAKNIKWKVDFGQRIGQHHNHERSNMMGYDLVWRIDDDEVAAPDVLEKLLKHFRDPKIGAVGGAVITPGGETPGGTNRIVDLLDTPNLQWSRGSGSFEVEHLYSSFLYRANKAHYCLELSPVAHREETLFSHELMLAGYRLIVDKSAVTYHYRSSTGGIRDHKDKTMFDWDERIFVRKMESWGYKMVSLDCGLGDHFAFLHSLPKLIEKYKRVIVGCCYPEVFEDYVDKIKMMPVGAIQNVVQIGNIYRWMTENNWKGNLMEAFAAQNGVQL